jgi:hypothetical protein
MHVFCCYLNSYEYTNFLKDVVISNWNGFAKGMISHGMCKNPGMVVKIKFRYADSGEKFIKIFSSSTNVNSANRTNGTVMPWVSSTAGTSGSRRSC